MEKKLMTPKGRLQWFLAFIALNIDKLPDQGLFKLWTELREIAYGDMGVLAIRDEDIIRWEERREETRLLQGIIKDLIDNILAVAKIQKKRMIRPISSGREMEIAQKHIDGKVSGDQELKLHNVIEEVIKSELHSKPLIEWARPYVVDSLNLKLTLLADGDSVVPYFPHLKDKLLLEVTHLLSQFPLSDIRQCERSDCRAYFLKATQKEKHFCTNKCVWIVNSRKRSNLQSEDVDEGKEE